jgi:chaperonin GroEL
MKLIFGVNNLRKQVTIADTGYEKEKLQDRIAKLSGGIAVIRVGAVTETEMKDKKLRLEDAINATRAAVEEGIVPGGGATLVHLSENLVTWAKNNLKEDELIGAMIISRAILAPLRRISRSKRFGSTSLKSTSTSNSLVYVINVPSTFFRRT